MNDERSLPSPVAIDGPAASGKSTVGEALAAEFGYAVLDTGMTYRAFTYEALRRAIDAEDREACARLAETIELTIGAGRVQVDGEDVTAHLRDAAVESTVSGYSAIPEVRTAMVRIQRVVGAREPTVVIGRDIGTVVFPEAPLKLFLTADPEERARRRSRQSGRWGRHRAPEEAGADIRTRDSIDSTRAVSPTVPADDAIVIDTSHLTQDEVIDEAISLVREWRG